VTKPSNCPWYFLFCFVLLAALGFELRASHLLGKHSYHSTSPCFVMGFFQIESHELFALELASNNDPLDLCILSS
jgi:hypothetical protein